MSDYLYTDPDLEAQGQEEEAWQAQGGAKFSFMQTAVANDWPFGDGSFKMDCPLRNLQKAGALIAAEIDRLQRKHTPTCEFCNGPCDRDGGCVCDVEGAEDRAQ